MKDEEIVELYWARSERALAETERSCGKYCRCIAGNILTSAEDCEECVNDAYLDEVANIRFAGTRIPLP